MYRMTMRHHFVLIFLFFSICFLNLFSQNFDYHREESAAISWNGAPYHDPRMLASGGISLMAAPGFSAAINPALLTGEKRIGIAGSLAWTAYEAFQYYGVNQGVLTAPGGFGETETRFSGLTFTLPLGAWGLSGGWRLSNIPARPSFNYTNSDWGWEYSGDFSGSENIWFAAAAWRPDDHWSLGLRLDYQTGRRSLDLHESYLYDEGGRSTIGQAEEHHSRIVIPVVGVSLFISPAWVLAASAAYPLKGEVVRSVTRSFANSWTPGGAWDQETATDTFYKPATGRLSTALTPFAGQNLTSGSRLILAAEAEMVFWSSYKYEYFSEEMERDMRNTVSLALALEQVWRKSDGRAHYSLRLGYRYDPQPVRDPITNLHTFSGGFGMEFRGISIDMGIAYYHASAAGVGQDHFLYSASIFIPFKRGE